MTRGSELRTVGREGKRIRTEHLELRVVASLLHHPRVGFIVPKHGRNSVERNTVKRRLWEIVRQELLPTLPHVDVVVRARREAYQAPQSALRAELLQAAERVTSIFGSRPCAGS